MLLLWIALAAVFGALLAPFVVWFLAPGFETLAEAWHLIFDEIEEWMARK